MPHLPQALGQNMVTIHIYVTVNELAVPIQTD